MTAQEEFDEVDSLADEAHARRKELDAEKAELYSKFGNLQVIPKGVQHRLAAIDHESHQIDTSLRQMINSQHAPIGYLEHYNQKYLTPQQPAAPAQPETGGGFGDWLKTAGSRIGTGLSDTADYVVKNPVSALKHIEQGKNELVSSPLRAIESLVTNKRFLRGGMDRQKQEVAEYDQSRGIDPRSTGPVVAETMGQMAVPLPMPKAMAPTGSWVKDFFKGVVYSSVLHAIERKANDEPVFDEGLGASAIIGGGLSALLGRFAPKTGVNSTGSGGSAAGGIPPSTAPPNAGGTIDNVDASFVRGVNAQPPPTMPPRPMRQLMSPGQNGSVKPGAMPNGPQGPIKTAPPVVEPTTGPSATEKLLRRKPPMPSMADAAAGIEAEKASRVAQGMTPDNVPVQSAAQPQPKPVVQSLTPKQSQAIPPNKIIDVAKQMDDEVQRAGEEALIRDVLSKKVKANDVKVKPKKGEAPIAAVKDEVGATPVAPGQVTPSPGQVKPQAVGRPPQPPAAQISERNVAPTNEKPKVENIRLEDYLQKQGYKIETKEPFPGEKSYNVKDPITGDTIARGDREQLVHALNMRNEGKGFKLYSGVDPTPLYEKVKSMVKGVPDDIEITNAPHREKIGNLLTREAGLSTPQFNMRKNPAGSKITKYAVDFEDMKHSRVSDLFHEPQPNGTYKDTKAMEYFSGSDADKQAVNDILVVGDRIGAEFTAEQLIRNGATAQQARMYEGVREMLNKTRDWIKDIGTDTGRLKGYIPRVWHGELELFVNGEKYVPTKNDRVLGSSFSTLHEAAPTMWKLRQENPGAKIEARFFTDPNYLGHRGIRDAKEVGNIKAKLDKMGALTKEQMNELFNVSKSYKDFARHLMERGDAQGYETEGLDKVLFSYVNQAAKAVEGRKLRDAVEKVMKDEGTKLTGGQVKYLNDYVDRVLGKPTWDKLAFDTFVRETWLGKWIDPIKLGGGLKTAKDWTTYKSLGFGNVSWALVNLDSISRHVWPLLQRDAKGMGNMFASEKYLGSAVKEFFKNKALRQKLAHNNVIDIQQMSEIQPTVQRHIGKWTANDVIMVLGKQTEEFTRGVAAIARYRMALDQGLADNEAMRVASHFVAETVGRYSKAGKPQAFTGPLGGAIGMFKTYPIVMLQNMVSAFESKDPGVIVRYMLASLAAGGVIGAIPGSEELDNLATRVLGKSPIQWGYENLGEGIMTGLASLDPVDIDLSRKAGLPDVFPNTTKDWAGPVFNTYGQAIADLMNGEYKEALRDLIPTSLRNALSVSQQPGKVVGRYDKPVVELEPGQYARIKRGIGFQSPAETRALRDYEYLNTTNDARTTELRGLARLMYKRTATPEDSQRFHELGGTNRMIRNEAERETLTIRQRQEKRLPRQLRGQLPSQ